jgi:hypothetical protein
MSFNYLINAVSQARLAKSIFLRSSFISYSHFLVPCEHSAV